MKRTLIYVAGFLLGLSPFLGRATDYTFQLVTAPGYTHTWGSGINNSGAIVFRADAYDSFLRTPSGCLTQLVYSASTPTVALGINDLGTIIGDVYNPPTSSYIGFIRATNGTFSDFTYPGAVGPEGGMQANDINDAGVIVGAFALNSTNRGAFIRLPNGQFETFRYLDAPNTSAYGINNAGEITGQFFDGIPGVFGHQSSFLRRADGSFVSISVPGASETQVFGINNVGQMVGLYISNGVHGFVRDRHGSFSTIDMPGAESIQPWGINDAGQIAGSALVDGRNYAFIATPIPEPRLSIYTAVELVFSTETNKTYQLQYVTGAGLTNWTSLGTPIVGSGTNISMFDSTRSSPGRLYRFQIVP